MWDENLVADELLGEAEISVLRFFDGKVRNETISFKFNGKENVAGKIQMEISYVLMI